MRAALRLLGRPRATVSVVLVDDETIRALNRDYREVDRATDVLSFPMAEPSALENPAAALFLGEIYISVETARARARGSRRRYGREVAHLAIHGLLHLLGEDHPTPAARRRMASREASLLASLRVLVAALTPEVV